MIELVLNSEIYKFNNIKNAAFDYRDYADIEIIMDNTNKLVVQFYNCKFDPELTIKEFESYLIGLENS